MVMRGRRVLEEVKMVGNLPQGRGNAVLLRVRGDEIVYLLLLGGNHGVDIQICFKYYISILEISDRSKYDLSTLAISFKLMNAHEEHGHQHDEVVIHIDKDEYRSPNPTTGAALYILGSIDVSKYDLYQEVPGHGDDVLVSNDDTAIELRNGEHFYSVQKDLNPGA